MQEPTPSARGLDPSAIRADVGLRSACLAAAADLDATRRLADALTAENAALIERLETEKSASAVFAELDTARRSEAGALRQAIAAGERVIVAKNGEIAARDKLIDELRRRRSSPWRRLGDILIGAAVTAILK